jgi:predicted transcriptional regulator
MIELTAAKKNRVHLPDYQFKKDIENRMLLSDFSDLDLQILEELLFSSLKTSVKKLSRQVNLSEEIVTSVLNKIAPTGLISVDGDIILIDKEMRKYFEVESARFNPDFKPDFDFFQQLLHKVPIEHLPNWYATPKTSNDIFLSIIEKYLSSPQIFQRYLAEIPWSDPVLKLIVTDLFKAPEFKLLSSDVIAKYNLKRADFEYLLLLLEFHFVACVSYKKEDDHWVEVITPFYEWHQYLLFLKSTETPLIQQEEKIQKSGKDDFYAIDQMTQILQGLQKTGKIPESHFSEKLALLRLIDQGKVSETGAEWLEMTPEKKSLYLYRNPLNRILSFKGDDTNSFEKSIREAEKAIRRVLHGKWVLFDDFFQGITVAIRGKAPLEFKKIGKQWRYTIPTYDEQDKAFMKAVIEEWLFEMGVVSLGTYEDNLCFRVTHFGRYFFEA